VTFSIFSRDEKYGFEISFHGKPLDRYPVINEWLPD
jgi:hypothetical protein